MTLDPFAVGTVTLHGHPSGRVAASYEPESGTPLPCEAIVHPLDVSADAFGLVGTHRPLWEVWLRQSEVAVRPARGDRIAMATLTVEVQSVEEDAHGLRWKVQARPLTDASPLTSTGPFFLATATLHGDPSGGRDGTYTPDGGAATATRIVWRWDDAPADDGFGRGTLLIQRRGASAFLLEADVPVRPRDGDLIDVDDAALVIRQAWRAGGGRWRCECDEADIVSAVVAPYYILPQVWEPLLS